jgi:DNA polymerase-1
VPPDVLEVLPFRHIVVADFEFEFGGHASFEDASRSGERPRPLCMVARELRSGQTWRLWRGEFGSTPPFPIGRDALFVAYYASAELGCFRALGWPMPANILDLFAEFRDRTNGLTTLAGSSLVGALTYAVSTQSLRRRKTGCACSSCGVGPGRRANGRKFSNTARPT